MSGSSYQFSSAGFVQVEHGEQVGKLVPNLYMLFSTKVPKGV
jgi:hypothetical protein